MPPSRFPHYFQVDNTSYCWLSLRQTAIAIDCMFNIIDAGDISFRLSSLRHFGFNSSLLNISLSFRPLSYCRWIYITTASHITLIDIILAIDDITIYVRYDYIFRHYATPLPLILNNSYARLLAFITFRLNIIRILYHWYYCHYAITHYDSFITINISLIVFLRHIDI